MIRLGYGLLLFCTLGIFGCGGENKVQYEDIVVGTGPEVTKGKVIDCFYTGWLKNGTKFDSNVGKKPFSIRVGAGEVIKGWDEGIPGMKEGGKRKLLIPPDLAYGATANGSIPAYSDLIFEVEVVKVR